MKKVIAFMLVLALVFASVVEVAAADTKSKKATTIRLTKSEGTVTVANAAGVKQVVKDGGKLLSGYTVSTGSDGIAYLSLDDARIVKLDIRTTVQVKKRGNKVQVFLENGSIYCDVQNKLAGNEELVIKTTNTTTGVRGTTFEIVAAIVKEVVGGEIPVTDNFSIGNSDWAMSAQSSKDLTLGAEASNSDSQNTAATQINLIQGLLEVKSNGSSGSTTLKTGESMTTVSNDNGKNAQSSVETLEPQQLTPETLKELLDTADAATQNMIRNLPNYDDYVEAGKDAIDKSETLKIDVKEQEAKLIISEEEFKKTLEVKTEYQTTISLDDAYEPVAPQYYTVTLVLSGCSLVDVPDVYGWNAGTSGDYDAFVLTCSALAGTQLTLPGGYPINGGTQGYLLGWCTDSASSSTPMYTYTVNGNTVLYAKYGEANIVDVKPGNLAFNPPVGWYDVGDGYYATYVVSGASVKLPDMQTQSNGYNFLGWFRTSPTTGNVAETEVIASETQIRFEPKTEAVTYNATLYLGNVTSSSATTLANDNSGWKLNDAGTAIIGTFAGVDGKTLPTIYSVGASDGGTAGDINPEQVYWYTAANAGGVAYTAIPEGTCNDIVWYASTTPAFTVQLTIDMTDKTNVGTTADDTWTVTNNASVLSLVKNVASGSSITLPSCSCAEYTFKDWYRSSNTSYASAGAIIVVNSSITYSAEWAADN